MSTCAICGTPAGYVQTTDGTLLCDTKCQIAHCIMVGGQFSDALLQKGFNRDVLGLIYNKLRFPDNVLFLDALVQDATREQQCYLKPMILDLLQWRDNIPDYSVFVLTSFDMRMHGLIQLEICHIDSNSAMVQYLHEAAWLAPYSGFVLDAYLTRVHGDERAEMIRWMYANLEDFLSGHIPSLHLLAFNCDSPILYEMARTDDVPIVYPELMNVFNNQLPRMLRHLMNKWDFTALPLNERRVLIASAVTENGDSSWFLPWVVIMRLISQLFKPNAREALRCEIDKYGHLYGSGVNMTYMLGYTRNLIMDMIDRDLLLDDMGDIRTEIGKRRKIG